MRRSLLLLLTIAFVAMVLMASPSSPVTESRAAGASAVPRVSAAVIQGDVNCSGAADSIDSLQILRSTAGLPTTADCLQQTGDVNCDAATDSLDSLLILRYVAGPTINTAAGCAPIGEPLGARPSSDDLIDQALTGHQIDEETALVYKVYAGFGDSRLPLEYKGDDSQTEDAEALRLAAVRFDSLSPQHQAILAPFLLPPSAPGSWLELQSVAQSGAAQAQAAIQWTTFTAVGGKVKVWAEDRYPGDADKAQGVAAAMTAKIWGKLKDLVGEGHMPISDHGLANNGGDDALDIYLVHMSDRGVTEPADPKNNCQLSPNFLLVNSDRPLGSETSAGILQTVAHETFHAVQSTYPLATGCWFPEYAWFSEASAKWVEDYVYPQAQSEQPYANAFLKSPGLSLEDTSGIHEYGAYLLPFYLARMKGQPLIVRTIWENFQIRGNSLEAVNDALLQKGIGGFDARWPEFALYNWNRPPVDAYKNLDHLNEGAHTVDGGAVAVTLGGAPSREFEVSADVSYLAALYHHFSFGDDAVHSVVFQNTIADYPHARVQTLLKIGGQWKQPEDWTHDTKKTFCRDFGSQHIEELVIIISYSNWEQKDAITPEKHPSLEAKAAGCTNWEGTITLKFTDAVSGIAIEVTTAVGVLFEFDRVGDYFNIPDVTYYKAISGQVGWTSSYSSSTCSATVSGSYSVFDSDYTINLRTLLTWDDGQPGLRYYGQGMKNQPPPTGNPCWTHAADEAASWFQAGDTTTVQRVSADGVTIAGTYTLGPGFHDNRSWTWTWNLHRVPPSQ